MKFFYIPILAIILCSCERNHDEDPIPHSTNEIENVLIHGISDVSFHRIVGGVKGDGFYSCSQTTDLGYVFCGYTYNDSASERDVLVMKTNEFGETDWTQRISDEFDDTGWSIDTGADNCFIISSTISHSKTDYMIETPSYSGQLIKLDANGNQLWNKTYSFGKYTHFPVVKAIGIEGYIVAGVEYSNNQAFLMRTDINGEEIWRRVFTSPTEFYDIEITKNNDFIIAGTTEVDPQKNRDIYIEHVNSIGETIWSSTIGDDYDNTACCIKETPHGYLIGGNNSNTPIGASGFISLLDSIGSVQWTKEYHQDQIESIDYLVYAGEEKVIATARERFSTSSKAYLLKLSILDGEKIWQKEFNYGDHNMFSELHQCNDNGYIFAGHSAKSGNANGYIVKTDENGN